MSAAIRRSAPSMMAPCSFAISMLVAAVGVAGLILPYHNVGEGLFGIFLCCLVVARFYQRIKYSWPIMTADLRELVRELSRMVYLILYSVVGLTQLSNEGLEAPQGLRVYLAYGMGALILIRILAALCAHIAATTVRGETPDVPPQPARSAM